MSLLSRLRSRLAGVPLRYRLPASFAGVALLTMLVLGAILVPLLSSYYGRAEVAYLKAGAERASRDLAAVDWVAVAEEAAAAGGTATGTQTTTLAEAERRAQAVALATQARVEVLAPDGSPLVDSGTPDGIDPEGILSGRSDGVGGRDDDAGRDEGPRTDRDLPSPIGGGLFGDDQTLAGQRSGRSIETDLTAGGEKVAVLRLSEGPAYGAAVLRTTVVAWSLAGVAAVILAAIVGWLTSRRITRPLLAMTVASGRMAHGDLSVRAPIERADEIGTLAHSFNDMAGKVEHTISALQRFVADAAHELGTPLTALEADLEMAQAQDDPATRERLIARALRQAERLDQLSTNLLRLSRLDSGVSAEHMQPVDLARLLRDMADPFASRAEQLDIAFTLDLPTDGVRIDAQQDRLRTAIENLVDNALKFTPSGGSVVLGMRREAGEAVIWVEDTGMGIPPDDMAGLFGRFHRGRNASAYAGSGLGLAIVQATMEVHKGRVAVQSGPGGSRFELRLPLS